ncbi:MAG: alcohol dehydrogenase catalytic domain-containing protein [Firmicutes bacterium]|nr:alcohol dehydrogenase catalytic domain-containing protein [Bacillota bacterium]
MKAAVFKDIRDMAIEERETPAPPKGGLLIKVRACGICGGDVRNFHNGLKDGIKNQIMGHEIAGEVAESDSAGFKAGDQVALAPDVSCGECWYCKRGLVNLCERHRMLGTHFPGGFAQYMAVPEEVLRRGFIERIPDGMPYRHAAFAETAAAVLACQQLNGVSLGDRVLIVGDGPVGCLHVEAAKARGAGLVLLAGMDRLSMAAAFSPDEILDNRFPEAVKKRVLELTDGIGADIVIIAVPSVAPQRQALELARKRGRVVIYGGVPRSDEMTTINSNTIHYREITLTGAFSYPATGLSDALRAIRAGQIHPELYISATVPLEDVVKGIEMVKTGEALKVMVDPWMYYTNPD